MSDEIRPWCREPAPRVGSRPAGHAARRSPVSTRAPTPTCSRRATSSTSRRATRPSTGSPSRSSRSEVGCRSVAAQAQRAAVALARGACRATLEVVVDQAEGLHGGVDGGRADEPEPVPPQFLRKRGRLAASTRGGRRCARARGGPADAVRTPRRARRATRARPAPPASLARSRSSPRSCPDGGRSPRHRAGA